MSKLDKILERLRYFRSFNGGIRYSSDPHSKVGVFQTAEVLLPYLQFPDREKYEDDISALAKYLLSQAQHDGGFPPTSEYPVRCSAVDSTAMAVYALAVLVRNFGTNSQRFDLHKSLRQEVEEAITKAWTFLDSQRQGDNGWPFIKDGSVESPSRVYSTGLVLTAACNCNDNLFRTREHRQRIVHTALDFLLKAQNLDSPQKKGSWGFCGDGSHPNPNISAVAVLSMSEVAKLGTRDARVETAIDQGVAYLTRSNTTRICREDVIYPATNGDGSAVHPFEHPYNTIVLACLLSGEIGYRNNKIAELVATTEADHNERVAAYDGAPLARGTEIEAWHLSATANTLGAFFSVSNVVEQASLLFAGVNSGLRELDTIQSELDEARAELAEVRNESQRLHSRLEATEASNSSLQNKNNSLSSEIRKQSRWHDVFKWSTISAVVLLAIVCTVLGFVARDPRFNAWIVENLPKWLSLALSKGPWLFVGVIVVPFVCSVAATLTGHWIVNRREKGGRPDPSAHENHTTEQEHSEPEEISSNANCFRTPQQIRALQSDGLCCACGSPTIEEEIEDHGNDVTVRKCSLYHSYAWTCGACGWTYHLNKVEPLNEVVRCSKCGQVAQPAYYVGS